MSNNPTIIERAYQLAQSGTYGDSGAIIKQLKLEGYDAVERHFASASLRRSLRDICKAAVVAQGEGKMIA